MDSKGDSVPNKKVPFPSEFLPKGTSQEKIAEALLGSIGKMVGASKSIYLYNNPNHCVVFNANICTKEDGKIWYGDIDLTIEHKSLQELAQKLNKTIYVLPEPAARFDKEKSPSFKDYIALVDKFGTLSLSNLEFYYLTKNVPYAKIDEEIEINKLLKQKEILNQDDYEPIELPPLSSIRVLKKMDPINLFWKKIIENYGKDSAQEIFNRLYITHSYYEGLRNKLKKYLKNTNPILHPVKLDQQMSWHLLDIGPKHFEDEQPWEEKNTGYLKK